jgi:hypothetical protein
MGVDGSGSWLRWLKGQDVQLRDAGRAEGGNEDGGRRREVGEMVGPFASKRLRG